MAEFREYDPERDREAVHRIWKEIGWLEERQEGAADTFLDVGTTFVADINEAAECLVITASGTIRYLETDLPFSCVASVSTSRIARRQGLAQKLTALAVAHDASEGALVSGLEMFEQGFYDKLGFGTGSYENWISFDPGSLRLKTKARLPSRLTVDDWEKVHESRIRRKRRHGACSLHTPKFTKSVMAWSKNAFGFGYFNDCGELTHHIWMHAEGVEHGPYWVNWMAYQTDEEFLELMAIIRNLGDQVHLVHMIEPPDIQMQDFLDNPLKTHQVTEKSKYETRMCAFAYWQMRILDLEHCMEKTHLSGEDVSFNLVLSDPIEFVLESDILWEGISGRYVVNLGTCSSAEEGEDKTLPTLKASVGAFTRMWLGVRPATGLAVTDELSGPRELLRDLDKVLCVPEPHIDWDF